MSVDHPYAPVRALNRGLALLRELNRVGAARPAELARVTGLDRTTTYRLLATLQDFGLIAEKASSDHYILTEAVRTLSDGFTERDRTIQIVTPHLGTLFPKVLWPTDFATFDRGAMVIRETTHRFSPYSVHRAMVGQPRALMSSALGRAALAGASEKDRVTMLDIARGLHPALFSSERWVEDQVVQILNDYETRGYGWSVGGSDGRISAIALAVQTGTGIPAALNLVFFSSAMSIDTAAERYLDQLRDCALSIELSFAADRDAVPFPSDQTGVAIEPGIER